MERNYSGLTVNVTTLQRLCALTDALVLYRDVVAFVKTLRTGDADLRF
jgi:hypothetical protein